MPTQRLHTQHQGEISVQKKRLTPYQLTQQIPQYIQTNMPQQHAEFYAGLPYLPLATLDEQGRPWVSILVTQSDIDDSIGITVSAKNTVNLLAQLSPHDPFFRAIKLNSQAVTDKPSLFAGVGIDFSNRRRNKLAGNIDSHHIDDSGKLHLTLISDEHLGNCPKYITVRSLVPYSRKPEVQLERFKVCNEPLSDECKRVINQASTVFLASKHTPKNNNDIGDQADMGLNHRGGMPGFVRIYEETCNLPNTRSSNKTVTTYLVLPDYSGNRFYQSLGNIQNDELVGLVFPDFVTGDMLYVTGKAKNLFDHEAQQLMPRMSLVTRICITGAVFIKSALNLRLLSHEQFSPYNPPRRYLREELAQKGHANTTETGLENAMKASLTSIKKLTTSISTFSFQLSNPIEVPLPGGFGIFNFSEHLDTGYSHMNEINPQTVNEDYTRTWTLSSAPSFNADKQQFNLVDTLDITVKHKVNGLISNFLHVKNTLPHLEVLLKGTGGGFSCFDKRAEKALPHIPENMLWVAGGVGITPFMSMWDGITNIHQASLDRDALSAVNIVLVFAGRDDDVALVRHFLKNYDALPASISLTIVAYQSAGSAKLEARAALTALKNDYPQAPIIIEQRRLQLTDLANIDNLNQREVFLCGPDSMMTSTQEWLQTHSENRLKIHQESYAF